jgi:hypothetical protein
MPVPLKRLLEDRIIPKRQLIGRGVEVLTR